MEKPPSFQWYPKDCDTDENVRLMDDAEYGFYGRCLNHAWINDGLPGNLEDVSRALGRPLAKVKKYWVRVGNCFVLIEDRYRNMKQEGQRKTAREFQESRREAANARWDNKRANDEAKISNARALHVKSSASASASASAKQEDQNHLPRAAAEATKKPRVTGTRISTDELPAEWAQWADSKLGWPAERATGVFEIFHDFWVSKSGKDGVKLDWFATWRNWCKEDVRRQARSPTLFKPQESATERAIRIGYERVKETGRL